MHIVYKITYKPHLDTPYPKYYIGSKYNYVGNYFGSSASNQIFHYTEGVKLKDWWKSRNKKDFTFEILYEFDDISPGGLVLVEREFHEFLNVMGPEYFNQSIATKGFCSQPKNSNTRSIMSQSTKLYWNTSEGIEKRKRLSERNRMYKSEQQKKLYQREPFRRDIARQNRLGTKHSPESKQKCRESKLKYVEYKGNDYLGWQSLLKATGVSEFLYRKYYMKGFDPEPNIARRHHPIFKEL